MSGDLSTVLANRLGTEMGGLDWGPDLVSLEIVQCVVIFSYALVTLVLLLHQVSMIYGLRSSVLGIILIIEQKTPPVAGRI